MNRWEMDNCLANDEQILHGLINRRQEEEDKMEADKLDDKLHVPKVDEQLDAPKVATDDKRTAEDTVEAGSSNDRRSGDEKEATFRRYASQEETR